MHISSDIKFYSYEYLCCYLKLLLVLILMSDKYTFSTLIDLCKEKYRINKVTTDSTKWSVCGAVLQMISSIGDLASYAQVDPAYIGNIEQKELKNILAEHMIYFCILCESLGIDPVTEAYIKLTNSSLNKYSKGSIYFNEFTDDTNSITIPNNKKCEDSTIPESHQKFKDISIAHPISPTETEQSGSIMNADLNMENVHNKFIPDLYLPSEPQESTLNNSPSMNSVKNISKFNSPLPNDPKSYFMMLETLSKCINNINIEDFSIYWQVPTYQLSEPIVDTEYKIIWHNLVPDGASKLVTAKDWSIFLACAEKYKPKDCQLEYTQKSNESISTKQTQGDIHNNPINPISNNPNNSPSNNYVTRSIPIQPFRPYDAKNESAMFSPNHFTNGLFSPHTDQTQFNIQYKVDRFTPQTDK